MLSIESRPDSYGTRRYEKDRERETDFISCVTFGKNAEFAEIYLKKGIKIVISGRIRTGSYTDSEGVKRYSSNVVVEEYFFAESKKASDMVPDYRKYMKNEYLDSVANIPVRVDGRLEKELKDKAGKVLALQRKGAKLIFPDVLSIEQELLK